MKINTVLQLSTELALEKATGGGGASCQGEDIQGILTRQSGTRRTS